MQRILCVFAVVFALATFALAQPDLNPGGNQGQPGGGRMGGMMGNFAGGLMSQNSMAMEILPGAGVFVLRSGVLAKFDPATLQPAGTLELFGPMPAQPALPQNPTQQDRENQRNWFVQNMARSGAATMLAKDDMLYIVIGTHYFRINVKTMTLEVKADLAAANAENNANPRVNLAGGAPMLKLEGGVLYVILGQELLSVNSTTGEVANRVTMPKELFPAMQGQGFGAGRGAAAGGGARGERGGAPAGGAAGGARGERGARGARGARGGDANAQQQQQ